MEDPKRQNLLEVILEFKDRDPFVPFQIVLTSGDRYLIESGANLVELNTEFFYASPKKDGFVFFRKNQIVAVERPDQKRPTTRRRAS